MHEPIIQSVSSFLEALKAGEPSAYISIIGVLAAIVVILAVILFMRKKAARTDLPAETIAVIPEAKEAVPAAEEPVSDDTAVIAAIVAAISAHTGKAPNAFRVVSFKRRR